jgi:HAD superfamily hydrolase (TIGR01509 family)
VGLLSNNTLEAAREMRKSGLDAYFDVFDISAETGHAKPLPEAFIEFARKLEVEPKELVFIDDSKNSLSSATEVGYLPILYVGYGKLIGRLTSLGLPA